MPWTERSVMDLRMCFIAARERGEAPFSVLCAHYGISRKTGYKWLEQYEASGAADLADRSRARHEQTLSSRRETSQALLALREMRPTRGPRKLLAGLTRDHPDLLWPAASTIGVLLRREGVSKRRCHGRRSGSPHPALVEPSAANESWAAGSAPAMGCPSSRSR